MPFRPITAALSAAILLGLGAAPAHASANTPNTPVGVPFSTATGDAPLLTPGMYLTTRPTGSTTRYAKIHRPRGGSVAVAIFGDVNASITTPDGNNNCSSNSVSLSNDVTGYTFVYVDGTKTKRQSYQPDACASATDLLLSLQTDSSSSSTKTPAPTGPVQLAVTVEPAIAEAGAPATKRELAEVKAPSTSTSGADLSLSTTFAEPTTLTPDSYPVSLVVDTTYIARVRVGWGQRLAASVDAPRNGTNRAPGADLKLLVTAFSPQWAPVGNTDTAVLFKDDATQHTASAYTAPVLAANRNLTYSDTADADTSASQWTTAAGWYYVAIRLEPYGDSPAPKTSVPARLNLAVIGTATNGPSYTSASGSAVAAPPATEFSQGGSTGSGTSTATALRIAGTALVLVIAGAAAAVLLRRRA